MLKLPARLVLDTNIVIDMLHFDDRHTRPLRTAIADGRVRCFTDDDCLAELERVTGYPEFGLDAPARAALLAAYLACVARCPATADEDTRGYALPRCRDADDQKFLIVAAPLKFDASLAMYCVGSPPHQFVSVTVRDGVDAAMLSMYMEVTHGG